MTVEAIRLQNFMAFEDTGWIELRPITLLFGRNSSGKSAIIRALRLLKQSLDVPGDRGPLALESRFGVDLGRFEELAHGGQTDVRVWFHFRCINAEIRDIIRRHKTTESFADTPSGATLEFALGYAAHLQEWGDVDTTRIELAGIKIRLGGQDNQPGALLVEATLLDPGSTHIVDDQWYFHGALIDNSPANSWKGYGYRRGRGFLPVPVKPEDVTHPPDSYPCWVDIVSFLNTEVTDFLRGIIHLGPIRPEPQRRYSFDRVAAYEWAERDWTAFLDFIGGDLRREEVEETSSWLQQLRLAKQTYSSSISGALVSEHVISITEANKTLPLPLSALGFGTSQVLPLIVQCLRADPGSLVIIEQPELHLHPRAQADLGFLFPATIRRTIRRDRKKARTTEPPLPAPWHPKELRNYPRFLLETHSEHLFLRLRRLIAETYLIELQGQIEARADDEAVPLFSYLWPDDLAVYFIERPPIDVEMPRRSEVSLIDIDHYGDIPTPPAGFAGFFSDDASEILKITKAVLAAEEIEEEQKQ